MAQVASQEPNRLGELMREKGLSRVEVAYKTGVGEATVYRWTSGRTGIPDDRKLALSKLFDVSVPYLMGWED